jgi:hypothetical protein
VYHKSISRRFELAVLLFFVIVYLAISLRVVLLGIDNIRLVGTFSWDEQFATDERTV